MLASGLYEASFAKLRNGSWGVRIVARGAVEPHAGDLVQVKRKDGSTTSATVRRVLWSGVDRGGAKVWLVAIDESKRSNGGGRSYSGGFCGCCGHYADDCADEDCGCRACGGMMR